MIAAYESGARTPSESSCERLLKAIGVKPSDLLDRHRDEVRILLSDRGITLVKVFGSVARGDDDEGSDLDLIVELPQGSDLLTLAEVSEDVAEIVGTDVDVVSLGSLRPDRYRVHRLMLEDAVAL